MIANIEEVAFSMGLWNVPVHKPSDERIESDRWTGFRVRKKIRMCDASKNRSPDFFLQAC
jgi:hypothetical protein